MFSCFKNDPKVQSIIRRKINAEIINPVNLISFKKIFAIFFRKKRTRTNPLPPLWTNASRLNRSTSSTARGRRNPRRKSLEFWELTSSYRNPWSFRTERRGFANTNEFKLASGAPANKATKFMPPIASGAPGSTKESNKDDEVDFHIFFSKDEFSYTHFPGAWLRTRLCKY